ncbi:MAG: hypothetical protein AMXMBFR77_15830 [Phycisphaerales bacterium]|nr:DUF3553 domain-containing protein [Phycisphaerales bacterium]GIK19074.1 MAG: hypothetical protein BroJett004_12380 [Planctomycetota bacterium]
MSPTTWSLGDRLIHAAKPEWGVGLVMGATPQTQDGRPCQRLVIRFEHGGVKTLTTAMADLRPVGSGGLSVNGDGHEAPPLDPTKLREHLINLPQAATDPFRSLGARLKSTLSLYRHKASGASLLEWASLQTGMADPLTVFSRHELEQLFSRFAVSLDAHARKLLREGLKREPQTVSQVIAEAPPEARAAVRRLDVTR